MPAGQIGGRRRLEGRVTVAFRTGGLPRGRGLGFARATSISPRTRGSATCLGLGDGGQQGRSQDFLKPSPRQDPKPTYP